MSVNVLSQEFGRNWVLYHGDCIEVLGGIPDNSIGLTVTSIPFVGMYCYTNSPRDVGNSKTENELFSHMDFVISNLIRVTMPGRLCCIHLVNEPIFKHQEGYTGIRDSRGELISRMENNGWIWFGDVTIDKNPQIKAARTKESSLLFKTLSHDSTNSRPAFPDYLVVFKKPGENPNPVTAGTHPRWNPTGGWITPEEWCRWARPVWYGEDWAPNGDGISETDVLNVKAARENDDEKHICPLQLGVIERAIKLWSNPEDLVLDPFNGIGSTGYKALQLNRKYVGIELKESYFRQAVKNLKSIDNVKQQDLLSLLSV